MNSRNPSGVRWSPSGVLPEYVEECKVLLISPQLVLILILTLCFYFPSPESEPIKPIFPEYRIKTPAPLAQSSSRQALWIQNNQLRTIIAKAATQLKHDYAQLKLMDKENEQLHQVAFAKTQVKGKKKEMTSHARLMTADANREVLTLYEWTAAYKVVLKSAKAIFNGWADDIDKYYTDLEKEVKWVANEEKARQQAAKKAEEESLKADIACQLEEREAKAHEKAEEKARADEEKQRVCEEKAVEKAAADEEKQWVWEEKVAEKAKADSEKQRAREAKVAEKATAGGGRGRG